jgi:hypothetical protein
MGLTLRRVDFDIWLHEQTSTRHEESEILSELQRHVGQPLDPSQWSFTGDDWVRVGPYGAFDILRTCMVWMTLGVWPGHDVINLEELDEYDELAREAIEREVKPGGIISQSEHILGVGDTDTLYIPLGFTLPYEHSEIWIASSPGAYICLREFADRLGFDLDAENESETIEAEWNPMATIRNVARIMFRFLREQPRACVAFT